MDTQHAGFIILFSIIKKVGRVKNLRVNIQDDQFDMAGKVADGVEQITSFWSRFYEIFSPYLEKLMDYSVFL
jgi:hypothetical protein